jgi:hypothetical protein
VHGICHCHLMVRELTEQRRFDWLDESIARRRRATGRCRAASLTGSGDT